MKIHIIDQNFLGMAQSIASYLVEGSDGHLLIETGPASTQTHLEQQIETLGFTLESIKHVLVTHIHLDHSGGAGYWAKRGAKVYVHGKGARHLIDPERLLSSAGRIYGDKMDYLWGKTLPVPEEQVVGLTEQSLSISGHTVKAWDTPGHAGHHLAFQIEDVVFTGDVAAVRIPDCEFVSVPAPPPEFQLETWLTSLDKLRKIDAKSFYLTHFGRVDDPAAHLDRLEQRLQDCAEFVKPIYQMDREELQKTYQAWDREQALSGGVSAVQYEVYERANPAFMSAGGLARYWKKKLEA